MATYLNFLNGAHGEIGDHVAQKWKNRYIIRTKSQGLTKQTPATKAAFTAFVALNRFASIVKKNYYGYLGLPRRNCTDTGNVAHYFKSLVQNGAFDPTRLNTMPPAYKPFTVTQALYDDNICSVKVNATFQIQTEYASDLDPLLILMLDDEFRCFYTFMGQNLQTWLCGSCPVKPENGIYLICLAARHTNGQSKLFAQWCEKVVV